MIQPQKVVIATFHKNYADWHGIICFNSENIPCRGQSGDSSKLICTAVYIET